jgi:xanthine dehydrogenase accessory factor
MPGDAMGDGQAVGVPAPVAGSQGPLAAAPTPPLSPMHAATLLLEMLEEGRSVALLSRSGSEAGTVTGPGPRLLAWADPVPGSSGTLGDPALDAAALELAEHRLATGAIPVSVPVGREVLPRGGGVVTLPLSDGTPARIYVEVHDPPATLVIVGAGHIARPLAEMGTLLGFRVTVLDDRPAFATRERFPSAAHVRVMDLADPFAGVPVHRGTHVVLVTRGHKYDYECLLRLLGEDTLPGYLGLIGSRRRIRATFVQLVQEGISRERIDLIRAPLGLDLGAQTPAEIAVAVAAELVMLHRGGSGAPLRERERILERFFPNGADEGGDPGEGVLTEAQTGGEEPREADTGAPAGVEEDE